MDGRDMILWIWDRYHALEQEHSTCASMYASAMQQVSDLQQQVSSLRFSQTAKNLFRIDFITF